MSSEHEQPARTEPIEHVSDGTDEVATRPMGTRSFVYGAKTLATSVVAVLLVVLVDASFQTAFWVLLSCGLLGVMFSFIERSTTGGAEVVNHRRVNLDVVGTVVFAMIVNVLVVVMQR